MHDTPVLSFPDGLAGFGGPRRFELLPWDGDDSPFSTLRAVGGDGPSFVVVTPQSFFADYTPELGDDTAEDALVLAIVTVALDEGGATANLLGPLVVDSTTLVGRQVVLEPERWSSRQPLLGDITADRAFRT